MSTTTTRQGERCETCAGNGYIERDEFHERWGEQSVAHTCGDCGGSGQRVNPRYLAYSQAHDMNPVEMLAYDRRRYPGGVMAGYVVWIQGMWREWAVERGARLDGARSPEQHADFDWWLVGNA